MLAVKFAVDVNLHSRKRRETYGKPAPLGKGARDAIYLLLGQVDKCVELLDSLKDKPLGMEIGELKTDATWDAVRDHEVFKSIIRPPSQARAGE
ncbi:MAG: hypothetical protein QF749_07245 [Verrucomicrobiota bacterium]|nr:hypothetical protein [Verrucomicrobiota bacterium]